MDAIPHAGCWCEELFFVMSERSASIWTADFAGR